MLLWKKKILWHSFEIFIFKKREKSLFCCHFCKHCFSYSSVIPAKCFVSTISVAKHSRLIIHELSLRKISGARKHYGVNDLGINRHRKLLMLNASICTSLLYRGIKGQSSAETWCLGFLVLESWCRGFSALESRCCGFLSSEKMSWNHDVVG